MITAPAHRGIAIPRFIESWVVGVNVWGRRPSRLVEPINMIREMIIKDQVRPFGVWISIICFVINLTNHCWSEIRRLFSRRFELGKSMEGNMIIIITTGSPISVGVMKEENRFSFILFLKGFQFLVVLVF